MKRGTPLARRTPLSNRPKHATYERPPAPVIDLAAARVALAHRQASAAAPRRAHAVVAPPVVPPKQPDGSFTPAVRSLILARDDFTCQRCARRVDIASWPGYSLQHRDARGMGGTSDPRAGDPANGITLCGSATTGCHGWVTLHPEAAEPVGLIVRGWADASTVPVQTYRGWILLTRLGDVVTTNCPPGGDAHSVAQRRADTPLSAYQP